MIGAFEKTLEYVILLLFWLIPINNFYIFFFESKNKKNKDSVSESTFNRSGVDSN